MSADAQPNPKQRANEVAKGKPPFAHKERTLVGTLCVVCGDRACSHLYYGVAACHGCKCFFWRTVKSHLNYTCRYEGNCDIFTAGRNACRHCRFTRCLESGMKIEAVRVDEKPGKPGTKRKKTDADSEIKQENEEDAASASRKRLRQDNHLLATSLLLIDKAARDAEGQPVGYVPTSLEEVMNKPELLNGERHEMIYRASYLADAKACVRSERRLMVWAVDWARKAADLEDTLSTGDKLCLLRACFAPLTLFELAVHSCELNDTVLPLPNNTYLLRDVILPNNSFLNTRLIGSLLKWAHRNVKGLRLSSKEMVLLKAMLVLNPDASGLSEEGETSVGQVRSRLQSSLFQFCTDSFGIEEGAKRLCSILLLIPQLQVMAVEMTEHLRMRNTFSENSVDPLLYQLFGNIFERQNEDNLVHSSSCSPQSTYDSS